MKLITPPRAITAYAFLYPSGGIGRMFYDTLTDGFECAYLFNRLHPEIPVKLATVEIVVKDSQEVKPNVVSNNLRLLRRTTDTESPTDIK